MWSDWHDDVRSAAAEALVGTGHGLVIHDSLLDRMTHLSQMVRRDAVRRLGQLGQSQSHSPSYQLIASVGRVRFN